MARFPPDHPQRVELADEVHARPPVPVATPSRATYVAVLVDAPGRAAEIAHLQALAAQFGVAAPAADARHFRARLGALQLKWERHGEFSGYTVIAPGAEGPAFARAAVDELPAAWLAGVPGRTVAAVHAELTGADAAADDAALAERFGARGVVGCEVADGRAALYTDFRLREDGCSRVWLVNRRLTDAQSGRFLQRLFEIEAYRVLALLALPIVRELAPRLAAIESALATLTDAMAREGADDEALLHQLTQLAAEVERHIAASQFRIGACEAYHGLVLRRIAELRETRLAGLQTIEEFMNRRLAPAVGTCSNVAQRLKGLAERIGQASTLLATRVGIVRERQNQALLASMNRRVKLQLRLQQTVEGLSVAAIAYYVVGLVGYAAKGLKSAGMHLDPDLAVGAAIPVVVGVVFLGLRRMRRHLGTHDGDEAA
ncbi:MAG TPA: DUF3422 domain-containing protein [Burkholderiaceae bacterium]|nr:DUF3422 domain-containing protein [Burkholderiaceae bacterium]